MCLFETYDDFLLGDLDLGGAGAGGDSKRQEQDASASRSLHLVAPSCSGSMKKVLAADSLERNFLTLPYLAENCTAISSADISRSTLVRSGEFWHRNARFLQTLQYGIRRWEIFFGSFQLSILEFPGRALIKKFEDAFFCFLFCGMACRKKQRIFKHYVCCRQLSTLDLFPGYRACLIRERREEREGENIVLSHCARVRERPQCRVLHLYLPDFFCRWHLNIKTEHDFFGK